MDKHGKLKQVVFEYAVNTNSITGERYISESSFFVWTDSELLHTIEKIPGVAKAEVWEFNCKYLVHLDIRYDMEYVKREIEAELICNIGEIEDVAYRPTN